MSVISETTCNGFFPTATINERHDARFTADDNAKPGQNPAGPD